MNTVKQRPHRPTFPSAHLWFQKKVTKIFPPARTWNGAVRPRRVKRSKLRGLFKTFTTPAATSTPGKLPEQLKAQSCAEPPWQGLMFQVPLPSGHPPIHNPTNKNTLWEESCTSASVWPRQRPPNSSNAPLCFALVVSCNQNDSNRLRLKMLGCRK